MRRDLNLLRDILLQVEATDRHPHEVTVFQMPDRDPYQVYHHLRLAKEAGFLKVEFLSGDPPQGCVLDLTWVGHEFLDNARNDRVWQQVATKVAKLGGSFSVSVVTEMLAATAKKMAGLD